MVFKEVLNVSGIRISKVLSEVLITLAEGSDQDILDNLSHANNLAVMLGLAGLSCLKKFSEAKKGFK